MDILEDSIHSPLKGKLGVFLYREGNTTKLIISKIVELIDKNVWHEHPALRAVIKKMGQIPHISGETDLKGAKLSLLACYEIDNLTNSLNPSQLYTPPSSGIPVYEITNDLINLIQIPGKMYFGYFFGTQTLAPLSIQHFGSGGLEEAHHYGIFGKTGYGKSVIAAKLSIAFARHDMGVLIIDPQGEFSKNRFSKGKFSFDYHKMLNLVRGGDFEIIDLRNVALSGIRTFVLLLAREGFFDILGVKKTEKEVEVVDDIVYNYENRQKVEKVINIRYDDFINEALRAIRTAYASDEKNRSANNRANNYRNSLEMIFNKIKGLFQLFDEQGNRRRSIEDILRLVLDERKFIILDLSAFIETMVQNFRKISTDEAKYMIMGEIINKLLNKVKSEFALSGKLANTVIFIDEAHLYVPQEKVKEAERKSIKKLLTDAIKMTRKYGIGWVFIAQSIADIDKIVYKQIHNYIFVPGLATGADADHVESIIGKEGFKIYKDLPDPKISGIYTFMAKGPIVSIATVGLPLVIKGFESGDKFINNNQLDQFGQSRRVAKSNIPGLKPSSLDIKTDKNESDNEK